MSGNYLESITHVIVYLLMPDSIHFGIRRRKSKYLRFPPYSPKCPLLILQFSLMTPIEYIQGPRHHRFTIAICVVFIYYMLWWSHLWPLILVMDPGVLAYIHKCDYQNVW